MTFRAVSTYMAFVCCLYVPWKRRRIDYNNQHPFPQERVLTLDGTTQLRHRIQMNSLSGQMGFQPPLMMPRGSSKSLDPVAMFSPFTPFINSRGGMFVPMSSAPLVSAIKRNANKEAQDVYEVIDAMYIPWNKIHDTNIVSYVDGE